MRLPDGFKGLKFLAIVEGSEAILFDTGYKDNMKTALACLDSIGASPVIDVDAAQVRCQPKFCGREWHEENWK